MPDDPRNGLLDAALGYVRRGIAVFPCLVQDKKPATRRGLYDATRDESVVRKLWGSTAYNIGVPTGDDSFIALDADNEEAAQWMRKEVRLEPTIKTARGWQWWFVPPVYTVRNSASKFVEGLDVRGKGGYVIGPPSIHPSGVRYELVSRVWPWSDALDQYLNERPPPPYVRPAKLRDRRLGTSNAGTRVLRNAVRKILASTDGQRNDTLNRMAYVVGQYMAGGEMTIEDAKSEMYWAARERGLGDREALDVVTRALKAGARKPRVAQ